MRNAIIAGIIIFSALAVFKGFAPVISEVAELQDSRNAQIEFIMSQSD